jgi:hypothetical protein
VQYAHLQANLRKPSNKRGFARLPQATGIKKAAQESGFLIGAQST